MNLKTKVVHSQSKPAWNVVGTKLGGKYKIARLPYIPIVEGESQETKDHADFISNCFNNREAINNFMGWK